MCFGFFVFCVVFVDFVFVVVDDMLWFMIYNLEYFVVCCLVYVWCGMVVIS